MTPERLQELQRDPGYQDVANEINRLTLELAEVKTENASLKEIHRQQANQILELRQPKLDEEKAELLEAAKTALHALAMYRQTGIAPFNALLQAYEKLEAVVQKAKAPARGRNRLHDDLL